jgi:hypothetical protein
MLKTAGGAGIDEGGGIALDKASLAVYTNGMYMSNPANFDAHQLFTAGVDVFTAQLSVPEFESLLLTGIQDKLTSDWTLLPNPASDLLTVKSDKAYENVTVELYDMFGQIIARKQFSGFSELNLDLSGLSRGVYNVSLTTGNSHNIVKLIKN